ncbi:hypothetical protein TcWFU_001485 [Taenia crassiceps]|uniref:Secreted protein n=1 Tax=Taenia crassiceps TaxID=6207 RepID=A0ABR4QJK4_9CEST
MRLHLWWRIDFIHLVMSNIKERSNDRLQLLPPRLLYPSLALLPMRGQDGKRACRHTCSGCIPTGTNLTFAVVIRPAAHN